MPDFELYPCDDGTMTVVDSRVGQAMHSRVGPYREATLLYTEQSRLSERLARADTRPLVILDVGMGIGANAIAAIDTKLKAAAVRPLRIHSYEDRPEGLEFALSKVENFPFLARHRNAADSILQSAAWVSEDRSIEWRLHRGDFRAQALEGLSPELVFFDFFSPKAAPELWTKAVFASLFRARETGAPGTTLLTYSVSTAVRSALILAGFAVGRGTGTDAKLETTIASNFAENIARPLDPAWLEKFRHSEKNLPIDAEEGDFEKVIRAFSATTAV